VTALLMRRRESCGLPGIPTFLSLLCACFCLFFLPALHADDASVEYKIKAGYLYNFTKFVTWPEDAAETFNLCIVGDDPFGDLIKPIEQRNVLGKPIKVVMLDKLPAHIQCSILFAGKFNGALPDKGLESVLTVGDGEAFVQRGGMISFANKEGRVKLQINLSAIKRSGLKISAKLLEIADIVGGEDHD